MKKIGYFKRCTADAAIAGESGPGLNSANQQIINADYNEYFSLKRDTWESYLLMLSSRMPGSKVWDRQANLYQHFTLLETEIKPHWNL